MFREASKTDSFELPFSVSSVSNELNPLRLSNRLERRAVHSDTPVSLVVILFLFIIIAEKTKIPKFQIIEPPSH